MSDHNDLDLSISTINRREAHSGRVSYGPPAIIYETSQTRIELQRWFIPRTDRTEIAARLDVFKKGEPPFEWKLDKEKSVSLNHRVVNELVVKLREQIAVAAHREDGQYISIKVSNGVADVAELDSAMVAKTIAGLLTKNDIVRHLSSKEIGPELVAAFRGAIRLQELRSALATLREYLDSGVTDEQAYQEWCEQHTWAFGNAYCVRDKVRAISTGDRVDLLLPTLMAGYRDLIELKRPNMAVLRYDENHRNYYFASESSKAIGQCHRYLDVLHEEAARGLRDNPEIMAYHPRATIVIGRSNNWSIAEHKGLHGLNRRLNGIAVMTYDQLLAQGERLVHVLGSEVAEPMAKEERSTASGDEDSIHENNIPDDDGIPF